MRHNWPARQPGGLAQPVPALQRACLQLGSMTRTRALASLAALTLLATGCGDGAPLLKRVDPPAMKLGNANTGFMFQPGQAISAKNLWVQTYYVYDHQIAHYDGTAWTDVQAPAIFGQS